jgi:hypothetical protein
MKYSDLVTDWHKSRQDVQDYEFKCADIARKIYETLKESLDMSDDKLFKMIDPNEEKEDKISSTKYSPLGAIKLTEKGWAKFGLYLILQLADNAWPKKPLRFISFIKIEVDFIRFKFTGDDNELKLSKDYTAEDEAQIIDRFENIIRNNIHDSFTNWHKGS